MPTKKNWNLDQFPMLTGYKLLTDGHLNLLTLYMPTPKNGQTHSNNLLAVADELFECVCGLALKVLNSKLSSTFFIYRFAWHNIEF